MNVSLYIRNIMQISEVDSIFKVSFALVMGWFDPRLTFANLNPDPNFNTLTETEKARIWKPTIQFTNTEDLDTTRTDEEVVAKIVRYGDKVEHKDTSSVYKTDKYLGKENQVQFTR